MIPSRAPQGSDQHGNAVYYAHCCHGENCVGDFAAVVVAAAAAAVDTEGSSL